MTQATLNKLVNLCYTLLVSVDCTATVLHIHVHDSWIGLEVVVQFVVGVHQIVKSVGI